MQQLKTSLKTLGQSIINYKFTIITLVYFCLLILYPSNFSTRIIPIAGALSLFFVMHLISKTRLIYLYAILFIILISFNAHVAFIYSDYISSSIIGSMVETNVDEAKSAAGGIMLPGIGLLLLTSFLVLLSIRELKKSTLSVVKTATALLLFLSIISAISFRYILLITDMRDEYPKSPLLTFSQAVNHYTPLFYGSVVSIASYVNDVVAFKTYVNAEKRLPDGLTEDPKKEKVKKIFLVIGESANPKYLSLFGYKEPTTPFLDSLSTQTNQLIAHKGRGVASQTRNAVPPIVSSNHARDLSLFREEYSVIELAKQSEYETIWMSNQGKNGLWNGRDIIGAIAANANHYSFWDGINLRDDFVLIPEIEKHYADNDSLQFFVLHIQGSHFLYKDRYDEDDVKALPGESTLLKHYERSIHHTDRLLAKVYTYVKKNDSSVLIYISDHGQEIKEEFGHGVGRPTKGQFSVPMVAINNSSIPLDSIVVKYIDNSDSILSNNSIPAILSQIMGYNVTDESINKSIANGKYVVHGDDRVYKYSNLD